MYTGCKGSAKCPTATFDELNPVAKSLTRPHFSAFARLSKCKTKVLLACVHTTLLRRAVERPTPSPLCQRHKFSHQVHCSHRKRIAARLLRRRG
ncbi:MAG: hypothetical protein DMF28_10035 [Verrucomicrobia bacterium]|nr:MAG: hypothetical protein DMF28_10035 [Verrucomicrobiota bacterium]